MLKLKNVSKFYYQNGVVASGISKINLELHMGEFVVITGSSGSGKSTLLNVLSGLDTYEEGEMFINGEETSHYTENDYLEYRRKYVSNIFQTFNLVNSYTVYQNIELALLMIGKNRKDIKNEVINILKEVGMEKYINTNTSKLSGGQKQRVAIARCLAVNTPIIVADEPTGSLDSKASREILKLLHNISKDKLVIVVTHNKEEIEEYATRLIKMHDGKIQEDNIIKRINEDKKETHYDVNNITNISKIKLGIRNAFNIPIKFALMFIIFLLISITLVSNYGDFANNEYASNTEGYNNYFRDTSNYRIVINKKDKSNFIDNDYNNINNLNNIDYIVKNDTINDLEMNIHNDNLWLYGIINKNKIDNVDYGRLPNNDNEIVVEGSKNDWYISDMRDDLLEGDFTIEGVNNTYKIVGIKYKESESFISYIELSFYISDKLMNELDNNSKKYYNENTFTINNNDVSDMYYNIAINNNVLDNEIWVNENINSYCNDYNCLNSYLNIKVDNIYFNNNKDFKITKLFNKDNSKNFIKNYDYEMNNVYLNESEYNKLFNTKLTYQSSIYIKDVKYLDETISELNNLGYNTLAMKYAKIDEMETVNQILNILKLVVTVILIVVLFFISYFIIRIIYKSRNSYYMTLRSLGSTKKVCINILMNEITTIAIFTYIIFLIFISLIQNNIIKWNYFYDMTKYVTIIDYLIVFMIIVILSILISFRYGKKIFSKSIIKGYGE